MLNSPDPVSDVLQQALSEHIQATPVDQQAVGDPVNDVLQQAMLDHAANGNEIPAQEKPTPETASRIGGLALRSAGIAAGGVADIPSMAVNAAEWVGKKLGDKTNPTAMPYPSDYINKGMTAVGVPEPKGVAENISVYGAPLAVGAIGSLAKGAAAVGKGIMASSPEEMTATGKALKDASQAAYQKMKDVGANISTTSATDLMKNVYTEISKAGKYNEKLHGGTQSVLDDLTKEVNSGTPVSLESLDQSRRLLQAVIEKDTIKSPITGKVVSYGEDAQRAKTAIKAIDDSVNKLSKADLTAGDTSAITALNDARALWSQNRKYGDMSRLIEESGGNPNNLKLRLQRLINSPTKFNNFNDAEKQAIKNAATQTGGEAMLNLAGKFGIDLGSPIYQGRATGAAALMLAAKAGAGAGAGYAAGGGEQGSLMGAAAAVAGGTVARQLQKWIASGRAEDVLKIIQSGTKLTPKQINGMSPKAAAFYLSSLANPLKKDQTQ